MRACQSGFPTRDPCPAEPPRRQPSSALQSRPKEGISLPRARFHNQRSPYGERKVVYRSSPLRSPARNPKFELPFHVISERAQAARGWVRPPRLRVELGSRLYSRFRRRRLHAPETSARSVGSIGQNNRFPTLVVAGDDAARRSCHGDFLLWNKPEPLGGPSRAQIL